MLTAGKRYLTQVGEKHGLLAPEGIEDFTLKIELHVFNYSRLQICIYCNGKQRIYSETLTGEHSLATHIYEKYIGCYKKGETEREVAAAAESNRRQTEGNKFWMPSFLHIKGQMAAKKNKNKF